MATAQMMLAGFGQVDITPTPVDAPSPEGFRVYDPISFRAVVLRQGAEAVALVSGDFFSFEESMLARLRAALADVTWLPAAQVIASVSHIGGAPVLFPSYVAQPCKQLRMFGQEEKFALAAAEAVRRAVGRMEPVRVGMGSAPAAGLHYNRRSRDEDGKLVMSNFKLPYPRPELRYEPVDENVYVVRFDRAQEDYLATPRGALLSFGCHALCNKDKQGHISADYPGVARRVLEQAWPGAEVSFAPGAIGDVVPFHRSGRTYESVGNAVGGAALYALERTTTRADVTLRVTQRTVRVPTYAPYSLADATAAYKDENDGHARLNVYAAKRKAAAAEVDYTLTAIRLGEGLILHLPGEVFVRTARAIQEASAARVTMILSGPSADVGYLCPPEVHKEGGMEPEYTAVAGEAETIVRAAACGMVGMT